MENGIKTSDGFRRRSLIGALHDIIGSFNLTEKLVFYILIVVVAASGLIALWNVNNHFLVSVPEYGGSIEEGIIGIPRFVNPVLALSDADKDLTALVYSGLLKATPEGNLVPDLAEKYEVSEDGKRYTFFLKDDLEFHDGEALTTDDIEFTIRTIQDPTIKSPRRANWEGVVIEKVNSSEIAFVLKQPYAPFIENFTVGILPKHIWKNVLADEFSFSELNINPIGSGPYKISTVKRNSVGLPTHYVLRSSRNYALGKPYITEIVTRFYQNEKELLTALKGKTVQSGSGITPSSLNEVISPEVKVIDTALPRIFGVFFNQNQAKVFINKEVRQALEVAIDKEKIVSEVLLGYGTTLKGPLPKGIVSETATTSGETLSRVDRALTILTKAGWTLNEKTGVMEKKTKTETIPLSFSLATGDAAELKKAAEMVKQDWEKIGATVEVRVFETGDLNQNIIRPRKYDALLFGEVVGRDLNLYPFWHSSQRNDPGLNIALYANIKTDKLLEELRQERNPDVQKQKINEFDELIRQEIPAVFIYSPHFVYIVPEHLQNVKIRMPTHSGERFLNVNEWYIDTNKVWKVFAQE